MAFACHQRKAGAMLPLSLGMHAVVYPQNINGNRRGRAEEERRRGGGGEGKGVFLRTVIASSL